MGYAATPTWVTLWVAEGTIRPLAPRPVSALRSAPAPAGAGSPPASPRSHRRRRHRCFRRGLRWSRTFPPHPHRAAVRPHPYRRRACPRLHKKKKKRSRHGFRARKCYVREGRGAV